VIQVRAPNGQMFGVTVPAGAAPGSVIVAQAPALQMMARPGLPNVIPPTTRGGSGGGYPGSSFQMQTAAAAPSLMNNDVLVRRQAESRRKRRMIIFFVVFVSFLVILGQIIAMFTGISDDTYVSYTSSSGDDFEEASIGQAYCDYKISSASDCRNAANAAVAGTSSSGFARTEQARQMGGVHSSSSVRTTYSDTEPSGCYLKVGTSPSSNTATFYYNSRSPLFPTCTESKDEGDTTYEFVCLCHSTSTYT
jgi:hypothetical protein